MKRCIRLVAVTALCGVSCTAYAQDDATAFLKEARTAAMTFQKALKKELMSAMQEGGPKKALEVCHSRAPEIAKEIGKQTGWQIGRTSLKTRNENNIPTIEEREVLEQFEQRKDNGEPLAQLDWWQESDDAFVYMKAIPMKGICTSCHGGNVNPSLKEHISEFYPHDMATGFEVGDIRGAFKLKKYLEDLSGQAVE